jgi:hypothetical protein
MRYAITAAVAFAIGFFTNEYRECGIPCEQDRGKESTDSRLEFRDFDIVLHVGADSFILDDAIAAAIALDINQHLEGKQ